MLPMSLEPIFANLPLPLQEWVETQDISRLVNRYGWSRCGVCGRLGIAWTTDLIPSGENLEMESSMNGWIHPSAEKARMEIWDKDKMLDKPVTDAMLFERYMRAVNNTIDMTLTYEQMKKG